MCGLAGFVGNFDPGLLEKMSTRLAHRGPDDTGTVYLKKEGVGLAHRRLSIIDTSIGGHQPMWDSAGKVAVIYNGEIYNYRVLREGLERKGWHFRGNSDTEVLLNLYVSEGQTFLDSLNGIFAFAIWDGRSREMLVARDGMGVKPFYFCQTDHGFLFASEIKSLLEEPSVARDISPAALVSHLIYLWSPTPNCILKSVRKLNPGSAMIVRDGRVQKQWNFYELPVVDNIMPISDGDVQTQLREKIRKAVERQMISDVPVGTFLSGGLDSSAVTAFAKNAVNRGRMPCFTIAIDDKQAQRDGMTADLPYAERVAKHLGVDLYKVYAGPEMADELSTMIYHLDEPQADPAPLNVLLISRLAGRHGIKVLLSGAGGDDLFGGYRRHHALLLERYWSWIPPSGRHAMAQLSQWLPNQPACFRRGRKAFRYAAWTDDRRMASYFYWLDPVMVHGLLASDLSAELTGPDPLEETLSEMPHSIAPLNRMLLLEQKYFLVDHNLNYTDKMSMAEGVEVRVPLLDPELVDLAARLPVEYKQRGKEGKWIFKKAMEGILPQDVIYRPKTGFGAPLRSWVRGPLKTLVYDILSEPSLRRRGWFDPKAVKNLLQAEEKGRVDGAYSIFALLCIELWGQIFLDNYTA